MSPSLTGALLLCVAAEPFDEVLLLSSLPQATSAPVSAIATATVKLRVLTFPPEIQTSVNRGEDVADPDPTVSRCLGELQASPPTISDTMSRWVSSDGDELADLAATTQHDRAVGHLDDVVHRVRDHDRRALPSSRRRTMRSSTWRDSRTPSAAVGSSRITTREANAAARATATAWRWPPDIRPTGAVEVGQRRPAGARAPRRSLAPSRARRSNRSPRGSQRGDGELTAGVEVVGRVEVVEEREVLVDGLDAERPRGRRRGDRRPARRRARSCPRRARCTPLMHLISVDLPAPLSPSSASTSPASTSRSTSSSAVTAPKRLWRRGRRAAGASRHASCSACGGRGSAPRRARA